MSIRIVNLQDCNTISEAFEKSGCNYSVEQAEIMNSANLSVIPNKKVLYRGDNGTALGVVSKSYGLIQNSEAFSFFDIVAKTQGAKITSVTEYNEGARIVLTAESKNVGFEARRGDEVGLQYRLSNSFDGSGNAMISFYALRLVCTNGLTRADENVANRVSIRHTKHILTRMEEALAIIAMGQKWIDQFKIIAQTLTQKIVDKQMVENFLNGLFGETTRSNKKKELVTGLFENGKGNDQGTAWDLYNGVTEYVDHYSRYTKNVVDEAKTAEYSMFGDGQFVKEKALEMALKM